MIIVNGERYEDTNDYLESVKKAFKYRYKKNLAVCNKLVKEKRAIYGATLWSGCSGLPWFLSFDLNEVLNYLIANTNWETHPDLARVEVITFGENPVQETIGYLWAKHSNDGNLYL